jgi:ribosomal-protein-serine acetyltransferase
MEESLERAKAGIDAVTAAFYGAFTNKGRTSAQLEAIFGLAVPRCIVTKASANGAESYSLEEFVRPRAELLSNGTLVDFEEYEVSESTIILDCIAHRDSRYRKSGQLDGRSFSGYGRELFHFVRLDGEWRITALLWMDERP